MSAASGNKGRYSDMTDDRSSSSNTGEYGELHDQDHDINSSIYLSFPSEINDGYSSSDLFEITEGLPLCTIKEDAESSLLPNDVPNAENNIYVAIGKRQSSIEALSWTLKNAVFNSSTTVFLIHVYPEIRLIPSPLGMLPKSQVAPQFVESHLAQEKAKRRKLLQKFLNMCSAYKVKVETILLESDLIAKTILDLIEVLNIKKLVLGISKISLRKTKSTRAHGIADKVLLNAPQTCDVTIICEGKEVLLEQIMDFPTALPPGSDNYTFPKQIKEARSRESFTCCLCFKPKVHDP